MLDQAVDQLGGIARPSQGVDLGQARIPGRVTDDPAQEDEGGVGVWKSAGNDHHQIAVTSSDTFHVVASGFAKLSAGDKYRIRVNLNLTPAGTADFDLNHSTVALVAF